MGVCGMCRRNAGLIVVEFSDTLTLAWISRALHRIRRAEALSEVGQAMQAGLNQRTRHREGWRIRQPCRGFRAIREGLWSSKK